MLQGKSEPRRLIKFGPASYVVSLPRSWVDENGLSKGDLIYFTKTSNNEFLITHQQKETKKEPKIIAISIDKKGIKDLKRELLSGYIAGFDVIKLQGKNEIKFSNELRDIIRDLTTLDIIEQTKNSIVAKDFLNLEKISLEELIRRMDLIIRSMIEDNKFHNNKIKLNKVYAMDTELNRITFMLFRFIKKALNDGNLANTFGLTPDDLLGLWQMASNLEKIGDEVKRVSRFLKIASLNHEEFEKLMEIYSLIEQEYLSTMKAYYNKNRLLALNISAKKDMIIEICNKFAENSKTAMVSGLIEKFKGMETYLVHLARAIHEKNQ